jgi:hypothetical protein
MVQNQIRVAPRTLPQEVIIFVLKCIMSPTMGQNYQFSVQLQVIIGYIGNFDYQGGCINSLRYYCYPAKVYRQDIAGELLRISHDSLLVEDHKRASIPVFQ